MQMQIPITNPIVTAIDAAHEARPESPRAHLGASLLGHHCDRYLWLSFRWVNPEKFSGRMLRLFRRGQLEEATVISDLRAIGCNITATELDTGHQQRVDFGCHVSGSVDGVINGGLPTAPNKPHVLEIKTHNKKSFDALEKDGVAKTKPMHFTQMQAYMLGLGIDRALYMAVCKDDDRLYAERVRLDREHATKAVERGHRIATADNMPEPCPGASPSWYLCKFCPHYGLCWGKDKPEAKPQCRACGYSTAKPDSTWQCEKWQATIPLDAQREGCTEFVLHPHIGELACN